MSIIFLIWSNASFSDHARLALKFANQEKWDKSIFHTDEHADPVLRKIIKAKQFQDTSYDNKFEEVVSFIANNKDWPEISSLKQAAESFLNPKTNKRSILQFFSKNPPITENGYKYYAISITALLPQDKKPLKHIKNGWIYGDFTKEEEKYFLKHNKSILTSLDHIKKIDYLLWKDDRKTAKHILEMAGEDAKLFYNAHIALLDNKKNKNLLFKKVPVEYRHLSRLLFRYLSQYRKYDKIPLSAANMIINAPFDPMFHIDWWRLKNLFARDMMNRKKYSLAYKIAISRKSSSNFSKAQSEWLAGWLALKYIKKPETAYQHFANMHNIVTYPITIARAAYWLGISAKAKKDKEDAHKWFREAAALNFTFYGQMAMIEMGQHSFTLPPSPRITKESKQYYAKNEFVRATNLLVKYRQINDARLFAKAAIERSKNYGEAALIVSSLRHFNNLFYVIELAKASSKKGYLLIADNHPTPYKLPHHKKIEHALTFSIIMKESAFNHKAISGANARGLMQLLPETGCQIQKKLKFKCNARRLTSDPYHNIILGNNYFAELLDNYDGSYLLAAAAYNAGPEPVEEWLERNGDPRKFKNIHEVIEWMELIPYYETRDYVQRILEYLQIYREILHQKSRLGLEADLFRGQK